MDRRTRGRTGRRRGAAAAAGIILLVGVATVGASVLGPPALVIRPLALFVVVGLGATLWLLWTGRSGDRAALRRLRQVVDQTQRRVLAAVERDRLAGTDRHRELLDAVQRSAADLDRRIAAVHRLLGAPTGVPAQRPCEADRVPPADHAPPAGLGDVSAGSEGVLAGTGRRVAERMDGTVGAAGPLVEVPGPVVDPAELMDLLLLVAGERPSRVLHVAGGSSAVWMAGLLRLTGGRLVAVEPDGEQFRRARDLVSAYGLTGVAQVRAAPPRPVVCDGLRYHCPDPDAVADQYDIDLLLIGAEAVADAGDRLPVPSELLAATATVVLVGVDHAHAAAVAHRWAQVLPGLTPAVPGAGRHRVLRYERPAVDVEH